MRVSGVYFRQFHPSIKVFLVYSNIICLSVRICVQNVTPTAFHVEFNFCRIHARMTMSICTAVRRLQFYVCYVSRNYVMYGLQVQLQKVPCVVETFVRVQWSFISAIFILLIMLLVFFSFWSGAYMLCLLLILLLSHSACEIFSLLHGRFPPFFYLVLCPESELECSGNQRKNLSV